MSESFGIGKVIKFELWEDKGYVNGVSNELYNKLADFLGENKDKFDIYYNLDRDAGDYVIVWKARRRGR